MSSRVPPAPSVPSAPAVPSWLARLVDDAAIFPPGNTPLPEAVAEHRGHAVSEYADLVGPFVVSDLRLPDLLEVVSTSSTTRDSTTTRDGATLLPVSVVVSGGAGALPGAVRWATRSGALDLRALEISLRDDDTGAVAHNAKRIVTAVDDLVAAGELDDEIPVFVEPPRLHGAEPGHGWLTALDEIAAMGHRLKFRTGGADADAFPSSHELATCIEAALDRELAFKCTAGLHHALRHRVEEGFERPVDQHGFLNVLLATRSILDGASVDEAAAVLDMTTAEEVLSLLAEAGSGEGNGLDRTRRWFTSFGCCSVLEPLEDLVELRLVEPRPDELRLVEPVETHLEEN